MLGSNNRLCEVRKNKESLGNYYMKIVEYNNSQDVTIEFMDKYKARVRTSYGVFKKGCVKNPYHPKVFNIGFLGVGIFKCRENGKITKCYNSWSHMLMRCYDAYCVNKRLSYKDVTVCEEWHNFQNFAKWYEENYYEIPGEKMCLDKDILIKGSKIYSPETCCFVPERIICCLLEEIVKEENFH